MSSRSTRSSASSGGQSIKEEEEEIEEDDGWIAYHSKRKDPYASLPRNEVLSFAKNLMLNQRMEDARKLLKNFLLEKRMPPIFMFKFAMLIFDYFQMDDFQSMYTKCLVPFFIKMKELDVDWRDIHLELTTLVVRNGHFELAEELINYESFKKTGRHRLNLVSIPTLHKCYASYIKFWKWDRIKQYLDASIPVETSYESYLLTEKQTCLDFMARCVVRKFKFYNEIESAVEFASLYAQEHCNNLSAQFLQFHSLECQLDTGLDCNDVQKNQSLRIECYKRIVELDPQNPVVSSICSSIPENPGELVVSISDACKDLMAFLDYRTNKNDINSWSCLIGHLRNLLKYNRGEFNEVQVFYLGNYHDHWQYYHFERKNLEKGEEKPKVLFCTLMGVLDDFVDGTIEFLDGGRGAELSYEVKSLRELLSTQ